MKRRVFVFNPYGQANPLVVTNPGSIFLSTNYLPNTLKSRNYTTCNNATFKKVASKKSGKDAK